MIYIGDIYQAKPALHHVSSIAIHTLLVGYHFTSLNVWYTYNYPRNFAV